MPHDKLSKLKYLVIVVICLFLVGQAISATTTSAQPGFTNPVDDLRPLSEPILISNPDEPGSAGHPAIAVCADGTTYVVWEQGGGLWYRVKSPSGEWNEASSVQFKETGQPAKGLSPAIAVTSDCVLHLVWSRDWFGNYEIRYTFNSGDGFELPENVSKTPTGSLQPDIAIDLNGAPRVVWVEADPGSISGGNKIYEGWPTPGFPGRWSKRDIRHADGQAPALAVDHENLFHLTWMQADDLGSPPEIWYKWQEQANEWSPWSNNLSESPNNASRLPDITISGDKVVVVWQETVNSDDEVYVRWRQLDSSNFVSVNNLSNSEASSRAPAVTADGLGDFFVAWDEGSPTDGIMVRPWLGIGNWWNPTIVSHSQINVKHPDVAALPGDSRVYAVWTQKNDPDDDTWDIYFGEMQLVIYRFYLTPVTYKYTP